MIKRLLFVIASLTLTTLCFGTKHSPTEYNYTADQFSNIKTKYEVVVHSQSGIQNKAYIPLAIDEFLSEYQINFIKPNLKNIYLLNHKPTNEEDSESDIYLFCQSNSKKEFINQLHYEFAKVIFIQLHKHFSGDMFSLNRRIKPEYIYKKWQETTPTEMVRQVKYASNLRRDLFGIESPFLTYIYSMITDPQEFSRFANSYPPLAERAELVCLFYDRIVTGFDLKKLFVNNSRPNNNSSLATNETKLYKGVKIHYKNTIHSNWQKAPVYGRSTHIEGKDMARADRVSKKFISILSDKTIKNELSHIYLFDHLCFKNYPYKAYSNTKSVFASLGCYNNDDKLVYDMCLKFSKTYINKHLTNSLKERWAKINKSDFEYTSDRFNEIFVEESDVYESACLSRRSRYTINCDIGTYMAHIISKPQKLKELMQKRPMVNAKANLIKEFLISLGQPVNI